MSEEPSEVKEPETGEAAEAADHDASKTKPKISKKLLLILIPIILLLIAGAVYFFVFRHHEEAKIENTTERAKTTDVFHKPELSEKNIYLNLEDFVVDLSAQPATKSHFLKLSLTLNLFKEEDTAIINDKLPIIRDNFQLYLRELRETDLNGSGGMYSLKEELFIRLNKIIYPVQVRDILFREILIR